MQMINSIFVPLLDRAFIVLRWCNILFLFLHVKASGTVNLENPIRSTYIFNESVLLDNI